MKRSYLSMKKRLKSIKLRQQLIIMVVVRTIKVRVTSLLTIITSIIREERVDSIQWVQLLLNIPHRTMINTVAAVDDDNFNYRNFK